MLANQLFIFKQSNRIFTSKTLIMMLISMFFLCGVALPANSSEAGTPLERSSVDRPDEISGYQVKLIYVVPLRSKDRKLDLNGSISKWIDEVKNISRIQIGLTPRFDTYSGKYDIGYLQSKYTVEELASGTDSRSALSLLSKEISESEQQSLKGIGFIIDGKSKESDYCGYASKPGKYFTAWLGESCWEDTDWYNNRPYITYIATTILHEWLHNLGVDHTCVTDDLMWGEGCESIDRGDSNSIDAKRVSYVRASKSGVDISLLPVWEETYKTGRIQIQYEKTIKSGDPWRDPKSTEEIWGYFGLSDKWSESSKVERSCNVVTATGVILRSKITNSTCEAEIPGNLKIGTIIYMTMNTTGLWQESIETLTFRVKGERGETDYCESKTCVVGETVKIDIGYCFKVDGFAALQKKNGEEWVDLKVHKGTKNMAGCKSDFPFSFGTNIRSLEEGVHTLRWQRADNRKFSTSARIYAEFQVTVVREATK